jgi:hypothetical protein
VDEVLAAAAAALGERLSGPVVLAGSGRSEVVRAHDSSGGTVIVKSYPLTEAGARSFAAEASGLALTSAAGVGPRLLAANPDAAVVVMTDLGDAPSLADVLLGESAGAAEAAVLDWARACGRLAVATAGREDELASLRAGLSLGARGGRPETRLLKAFGTLPGRAAAAGLAVPSGLGADLDELAAVLEPCPHRVFSPGDLCPDNNLLTRSGFRFIDYEVAGFHCALLDAAYIRMPFSTCWCVFRLPATLAAAAEAAYRSEVTRIHPALAADGVWQPGLRRAMAAWTIDVTLWLFDRARAGDRSMNDEVAAAPTARQLLRYRWRALADEMEAAGELPALGELMRRLLAATRAWDVPDLPVYPAFRRPA